MPIVDFKEILEAHVASGNQDSFELFCQEFMGFYSTVVSAGLNDRLKSYTDKIGIKIFNSEEIEEQLLSSPNGQVLFKRFF